MSKLESVNEVQKKFEKPNVSVIAGLPPEVVSKLTTDFESYLKNTVTNIRYEHLIVKSHSGKYSSLYTEYSWQAWVTSWKLYSKEHADVNIAG
jgi:hypothetical protein